MNYGELYNLLQQCEHNLDSFFVAGVGSHVDVAVSYFTGASFTARCENADGLRNLFHMLLRAYRTEWTEQHPTDVQLSFVYAS